MVQRLEDYAELVGKDQINHLRDHARSLKDRRVVMVNATKQGGGVAELLESLVPCYEELGIKTPWYWLNANQDFFSATKTFHNALQGEDKGSLDDHINRYRHYYDHEFESLNPHLTEVIKSLDSRDIVVVHDPQPLELIRYRKNDGSKWIWRKHIDSSRPNKQIWSYVYSLASKYDCIITSKDSFIHGDSKKYRVIPPSINPFTEKNRYMSQEEITSKLKEYGVDRTKPIITQVSRFDKWKDPMGVIEAYNKAKCSGADCQLVMLGSLADDDPEGLPLYEEMADYARKHICGDDIKLICAHDPTLVNAIQRASLVVLQKSLREGFALTVSEALWKGTPVIGTDAGGIPLQIKDGINGYIVPCYSIDGNGSPISEEDRKRHINWAAGYICDLVKSPEKAIAMGQNGRELVRNNFLMTRKVHDYLELFNSM